MRKVAVNVMAFGNLPMLLQSFSIGWELNKIGSVLKNTGIGLMLLPLRGISKYQLDEEIEVLCYENAWNTSSFLQGLLKLPHDLGYAWKGSPSLYPGGSVLDRVGGMNYYPLHGTIFDWFFFGTFQEAFKEFNFIRNRFRGAIETVHWEGSKLAVCEVHPEFRREICEKYGLSHEEFVSWLIEKDDLFLCLDTFHSFSRGSRDGLEKDPCISPGSRMEFLKEERTKGRVSEVHFRLNKLELGLILSGRAVELPLFQEMQYMYQNYADAIFILEIGPSLFSSLEHTAFKVCRIWQELDSKLS